jgi:hypothetical protein
VDIWQIKCSLLLLESLTAPTKLYSEKDVRDTSFWCCTTVCLGAEILCKSPWKCSFCSGMCKLIWEI